MATALDCDQFGAVFIEAAIANEVFGVAIAVCCDPFRRLNVEAARADKDSKSIRDFIHKNSRSPCFFGEFFHFSS